MQRGVGRGGVFAGLLMASLTGALERSSAQACSPGQPAPTAALPAPGTQNVSTATSLIVVSAQQPAAMTLVANGQTVPLSTAIDLGAGAFAGQAHAHFWQLRAATSDSMLIGGAEHVLSQPGGDGGAAEVTRFTTAAGYDKTQGTAPVLRALHLWRVRYPVADINSGNCVFAEYHGFITVDYDPATVPNTASSSVVHTFQLAPKNGGSGQTFIYVGNTPFAGLAPAGAYPLPTGDWQPELDPTRPYCLGISAFGDGDIARLPLASQSVCADVVQLSAAGAPPPPGTAGGGCAIAGRGAAGWLGVATFALLAVAIRSRRRRR